MQTARQALTPETLAMLQTIASSGGFAAAARELNLVPSALSYRVRQIEAALDVLLFDRSSRQARPTEAGAELLRAGAHLLAEIDSVAHRVKRVATGWEPQLTLAIDGIVSKTTVFELCESFCAMHPPTRIRLRDETLSGTLDALVSGQADLAIGVAELGTHVGIHGKTLGDISFVYAVAPNHALARAVEPLRDESIRQHRAVAVADSIARGNGVTVGLLDGQDVLTVASMRDKIEAQLRGLGAGFVPECLARPYLETGRLVAKRTVRAQRTVRVSYAWRQIGRGAVGRALSWWLGQLESPLTRAALLGHSGGV